MTAAPVLIHLPRIDNGETVKINQNSSTDQVFTFQSIPGLVVTVYAGTKFTLDDGSQPDPFPLVAVEIPLDRLPEKMATTGMINPFIVAFQPANAVASQPVAVNFPNPLSLAPGTNATLMTLDPTMGYMVPYGSGVVSNDGTRFIADPPDPAHPGHAYGLLHFDWHGPATQPTPAVNPSPDGCSACRVGRPVDVASGIVTYTNADIQINGGRGSIGISRVYRSLSTNKGPFGIGTSHNYGYVLNTFPFIQGQNVIGLVMPDGNQFQLSLQQGGTFLNGFIPALHGAALTANQAAGTADLKWKMERFISSRPFPRTTRSLSDAIPI